MNNILQKIHCLVLAFSFLAILTVTAKAETLDLDVNNINANGQICIAIFESADKFYKYRKNQSCNIKDDKVKYIFKKVQAGLNFNTKLEFKSGIYAVRVFLDKNFNNKVDRNFLGLKKEKIGYSNNPKIIFGFPYFSEIEFGLSEYKKLEISL